MNAPTIEQTLLASLTYLPLAFVLAACWVEAVSFAKKSSRHQPGITALLFGAVAAAITCIIASYVFALPAEAPHWGGAFGIASLFAIAATYTLRFYLKKNEPILPTKKLRDLKMGHAFALAASALVLLAGALTATDTGAPVQLLSFLPIALLAAVLFLEFLSVAKSPEAYQPAILAVLFTILGSTTLAIGAAATKLPPTAITPIWLSLWGIAAAIFIAFAYLSKLSARKQIIQARDPQIIALQTPAQRLKALSVKPSPAGYTLALIIALPLIALAHIRFSTDRDTALEVISKTADSVKEFAGATSLSDTDEYPKMEGSIGPAIGSTSLPNTKSIPENPFGNEVSEDMDKEAVEEMEPEEPPAPIETIPEAFEEPEDSNDDAIPDVAMTGITTKGDTIQEVALNISAIKPYDDGAYFVSKVQPILESHCHDCHGTEKKKGGLQLHNATSIRAGADSGSIVIAGNPERSSIFTSTTLGENDPDVMPSKGDLLSLKQQAILEKWILDGAHMDDAEISSALATTGNTGTFLIDERAKRINPPNASVIQALAQSGVQFRALSSNGALIKVDFSHTDRGRPALADLETIAGNIYHLDLSRTQVTDEDLAIVATYPVLHKLELSHTTISDAGIKHLATLKHLDTLNLYNTKVGNEGLEALHSLKSLEKIYAFNSQVSETAAKSAQENIQGLTVVID